ncbi:hypothetical protein BURMUCF2_0560 [Burkholderia multivorans CF2]|nr:hypothetical protein BURMUCF2_0560 [Burkholderia multivorans CF2]
MKCAIAKFTQNFTIYCDAITEKSPTPLRNNEIRRLNLHTRKRRRAET